MLPETISEHGRNLPDVIAPTAVLRLVAEQVRRRMMLRGNAMVSPCHARAVASLGIASTLALLLGACGGMSLPSLSGPTAAPEPAPVPEMPATIRPDEIVGRWGLASYQNPADRARTEAAGRAQCKQAYVSGAGPTGGGGM